MRRKPPFYEERVIAALESIATALSMDGNTAAELRSGLDAVTEAMATRADLDDLRLEVLDKQAS